MADAEITPQVSTQSAAQAPDVAAVAAPVVAAVVEAAPVAVPVADVAPVVESPKTESFLAAEPTEAKPDAKAAEVKSDAVKPEVKQPDSKDAKPVDDAAKPETAEVALPVYDAFKLPENSKVDEKTLGEVGNLLGQLELAKSDHAKFQEIGQKIVDLGLNVSAEAAKATTDFYVGLHTKKINGWREELLKAPDIGQGDPEKLKSYSQEMVNFIARDGGTKEEVTAFRKLMSEEGVSDSPALIRIFANLKSKIEKYEKESSNMLPGTKPATAKPAHPGVGMINTLYGKAS